MSDYLLQSGDAGATRLAVLADVHARDTERFLDALSLPSHPRCLDVGCGIGAVTERIAAKLVRGGAEDGSVLGIDLDPHYIDIARARAPSFGGALAYENASVDDLEESAGRDLVYCRFLLSHLRDPAAALARMIRAAKPGAFVAVEDVDFGGCFCHPPSAAYERYLRWYASMTRANGADPDYGRGLFAAFARAGLKDVELSIVQPAFCAGPGKDLAATTLAHIGPALVDAHIATAEQLEETLAALISYASEPTTLLSMPRVFQVRGRVS